MADTLDMLALSLRDQPILVQRYEEKIDYGFEADDCWVWTGALSDTGYGDFRLPQRTARAHRVGWVWRFGPVPDDYPFLDHHTRCVGRFCVRPSHLEPVTNAENQARRTGRGRGPQRALRSAELMRREARRLAGEIGVF